MLRDATGLLGLTWYNQVTYFRSRFRVGQRLLVYGKVERSPGGGKRIVHPEVDVAPDESSGAGVLPVYEKPTSMTVGTMRKIVQQAVRDYADLVPAVLPEPVYRPAHVIDPGTALRALHLPDADADVDAAQSRRVARPSRAGLRRALLPAARHGRAPPAEPSPNPAWRWRAAARSPIGSPRCCRLRSPARSSRVLEQIYADMARPHPMHRLVQGDVGSGKTIVALFAALAAIENGQQVAFMAPTELLAEQHFATLEPFAAAARCARRRC